jgi:aryl-alcohol dehydrogenase-like predicted oxidoreductase
LCLGTMTFGQSTTWDAPKDESRQIFDTFVEAGGNFIDTSINYAQGDSERFVGEFIATDRHRFVVGTKYTMHRHTSDPNIAGSHRKNMVRSLETSLKKLQTDYVDIYWVHAWDALTPTEEVMRALDDMVQAGKILYTGVSNTPAWVVSRANTISENRGWTRFNAIQVSYSLAERTAERELIPMARSLNMAVTAWGPLEGGLLSGKYSQAPGAAELRRLDRSTQERLSDRNLRIAAEVGQVAKEIGCTPAQASLAWVRQQGAIPIIGARTVAQAKDNLASLDVALDDAHRQRLDEISRIAPGYPNEFLVAGAESIYGGMLGLIDR